MGKQLNYRNKLIESGRLSGLRSQQAASGLISASKSSIREKNGQRFDPRMDARLKLQVKQSQAVGGGFISKISDARQLLLSKKKQQLVSDELFTRKPATTPSTISTNGRFHDNVALPKNHIVRSDGINTLVTLKNDTAKAQASSSDSDREYSSRTSNEILEVDRTTRNGGSNASKYQPIRIKIDNNPTRYSHSDFGQRELEGAVSLSYYPASSNGNSNGSAYSKHVASSRFHGEFSDDFGESMDTDDASHHYHHREQSSNGRHHTTHSQEASTSSTSSSSGYKLFISNLHPRVTEDDVLVNQKKKRKRVVQPRFLCVAYGPFQGFCWSSRVSIRVLFFVFR